MGCRGGVVVLVDTLGRVIRYVCVVLCIRKAVAYRLLALSFEDQKDLHAQYPEADTLSGALTTTSFYKHIY